MLTLKKSLGQHFLVDENVCQRIVDVLKERSFSQLLEVGPGGGALTKYLVEIPGINFKAVELDKEKATYLLSAFPHLQDNLIQKDFLKIEKPFEGPFTVIGNFPYNISSQILFKILEWRPEVKTVIGMFQKELAQRITSKEGNKVYGVISVLLQAFFKIEYLFEVSEKSFKPPPKVKSAVIRLIPLEKLPEMKSEKCFFDLVKTAFNQRRKTLRNAVRSLFDESVLKDKIFDKRAEQLSVSDFAALTFRMK